MSFLTTPNSRSRGLNAVNSPFIMTREYQNHVDDLESENFTLRMLLSAQEEKLGNLLLSQNIPDQIRNSIVQQEKELAEKNAKLLMMQSQLDFLLKENEKYHSIFKNTDSPNDSLLNDGAEATLETTSLNAQVETLRAKVQELENKNLEQEKVIQELQLANDELQNSRNSPEIQLENENMQAMNKTLEAQINLLEENLRNAQDELDNERKKSEEKDNLIAQLESQATENQEPTIDFTEIEKVMHEFESLKRENAMLQEKNDELNDNIIKVNDQNDNLKQHILDLENELSSILAAFEVTDSGDLIAKYETLQQINKGLQEQKDELDMENDELRKKLGDMQNTFKSPMQLDKEDTFDVSPNSKGNSTFVYDDGDKMSVGRSSIGSPKLRSSLNIQKINDALIAENEQLRNEIEELNKKVMELQKKRTSLRDIINQTSPTQHHSSPRNSNKANQETSPIKKSPVTRNSEATSPIKPKFRISAPVNTSNVQTSIDHSLSPQRSFVKDMQTKIDELTEQNKVLANDNAQLREQILQQQQQEDDPLASDISDDTNKIDSQGSESNNNSALRNSTLNNFSASLIISPAEQKLKEENEQLKQNLEEYKRNQSESFKIKLELNKLKDENANLKKELENCGSTLRVKMDLINEKQKTAKLEAQQKQVQIFVQNLMHRFESKMNDFSRNVQNQMKLQLKSAQHIQNLIPKILSQKSHFPLVNLRKDVVAFIDATSDMMRDLRDGATSCIRATAALASNNRHNQLSYSPNNSSSSNNSNKKSPVQLSQNDKQQLCLLKKKYLILDNNSRNNITDETMTTIDHFSPINQKNSPFSKGESSPNFNSSNRNIVHISTPETSFRNAIDNYHQYNGGTEHYHTNSHKVSTDQDINHSMHVNHSLSSHSPNPRNHSNSPNKISPLNSPNSDKSSSAIVQRKYSFILEEFQTFIDALWNLFGDGQKSPSITDIINDTNHFQEFIQKFVQTIVEKTTIVKKCDDGTVTPLTPIVVDLLKTVRTQVKSFKDMLNDQHTQLIHKVDNELMNQINT